MNLQIIGIAWDFLQFLNYLKARKFYFLCRFHVGSNSRDENSFDNAINIASELFKMGKQYGHHLRVLDIGGKFENCFAPFIMNFKFGQYILFLFLKILYAKNAITNRNLWNSKIIIIFDFSSFIHQGGEATSKRHFLVL